MGRSSDDPSVRMLRRQIRLLRRQVAFTILALVGVVTVSWTKPPQDTFSARQFFVLDEGGVPRGSFGLLADGQSIGMMFTDAAGSPRIEMRVDEGGVPSVTLRDADQRIRSELTVDQDGAPRLVLTDSNERPRAALNITADGTAQLVFMGAAGAARRALIGTIADGRPIVVLSDAAGETIFQAPLARDTPPDTSGAR